jgi:hypothetical protein
MQLYSLSLLSYEHSGRTTWRLKSPIERALATKLAVPTRQQAAHCDAALTEMKMELRIVTIARFKSHIRPERNERDKPLPT